MDLNVPEGREGLSGDLRTKALILKNVFGESHREMKNFCASTETFRMVKRLTTKWEKRSVMHIVP